MDEPETAGDKSVETVGGMLGLFFARSPAGLPRDVDRMHFEEVLTLVEAAADLSKTHDLTFEKDIFREGC